MLRFSFPSIVLLAACSALSAQTYKVIHNLGNGAPGGLWVDASISQGRGGDLFTSSPGSQTGIAAAFRIGPLGSIHVLHQWGAGAAESLSGLILGTDSNYYGITRSGGPNKLGTVYRVSGRGGFKSLHDFTGGSDGAGAWSVMQSVEGDYYVSTEGRGGSAGDANGSLFRMTRDGNMTLLHAFSGSDGSSPMIVAEGTDSFFYGVTTSGGLNGDGTIFRISSSGDFHVLHNFEGTDGQWPQAGLIQASDGNFYGTAVQGGSTGSGVLFRIAPDGTYTKLYDFQNGLGAPGRLVQATDGYLYGTTGYGGSTGYGVIYRATLAGVITPIHSFSVTSGFNADSQLMQHTNGKLYGATYSGGKYNQGVFYSFDLGLAPFVTYLPAPGVPGSEVQILGQGFTSATQVFFNGKLATSTVIYPTFLKATVPAGATTGLITVTTATGTLTSNKTFVVHP